MIGDSKNLLDVGCGEGALTRLLCSDGRTVTGIDPFPECIDRARTAGENLRGLKYECCSFDAFETDEGTWDAVIFVASLHHMEAIQALRKAKALLRPGGRLLVVGIAAPDRLTDWLIECGRVLPALIGTFFHRMTTSEELAVPTCYELPKLSSVRAAIRSELPGAHFRQGLYYRYLLSWVKQ